LSVFSVPAGSIGSSVFTLSYLYAQMVSLLENRNKLRCLFSEKPFTPINTLTETQADEKWFK